MQENRVAIHIFCISISCKINSKRKRKKLSQVKAQKEASKHDREKVKSSES